MSDPEPWGHSVKKLIDDPYITPDEAFIEEDSTACIEAARTIVKMARACLEV
jgi:hypothetical protein